MNKALAFIEHAPFASINKIWINTAEYLLLYAIIISLFYFLYDKKAWQFKFGLICMLLLSINISYKKIEARHTNTIAFLNLRKHIGIVLRHGTQAVVLSDLSDTDKNYQYSVQPYLDSSGIDKVSVCNLQQDIRSAYVLKKGNLLQFGSQRILILNKQGDNILLNNKLNTDYLYITGNPHTDINTINKNYTYRRLVIDGSNRDNLIRQFWQSAKNCSVLKRNISLWVVSN